MIESVIGKMIAYNGSDVRRINHALKVHSFARHIAVGEGLAAGETRVVEIAAILHDIGIHNAEEKYSSSAGEYQEIEGPQVARDLLAGFTIAPDEVERISFIVGNHHSYGKIDGADFRIVVEADFLVNIFEDGMTEAQTASTEKKIFATRTGKNLLRSMYPPQGV